jgi:C4-dicarboxylate transporter DctQ subunit
MKTIFQLFSKLIGYISISIATFGIIAGVTLAFVNVVARYAFDYSFTWAAELTVYFFLWSMFFAAVYCFKIDAHITINLFVENVPKKISKIVLVISKIVSIVFLCAVSYYGYEYLLLVIDMEEVSIDLEIPMWIPYMVIPIAFAFSAFRVFEHLIKLIFTPSNKLVFKNEHDEIIEEVTDVDNIIKDIDKKTGGML